MPLTWMDAKVGNWVVTPRIGKVVEVNALWYNTLCSIADFARRLNEPADRYETLVEQARTGFARFWSEAAGYCYDVIACGACIAIVMQQCRRPRRRRSGPAA